MITVFQETDDSLEVQRPPGRGRGGGRVRGGTEGVCVRIKGETSGVCVFA